MFNVAPQCCNINRIKGVPEISSSNHCIVNYSPRVGDWVKGGGGYIDWAEETLMMTPLRCAKTAGPRTGVLTIFDVQLDVICGGLAALLVLVVSFRCRYKELRLPPAWMVVSNDFLF